MSVRVDEHSPHQHSDTDRGSVAELRERAEFALDTLTLAAGRNDAETMLRRARELACPIAESIETSELTDVVVFRIGVGKYAVETTHTHHIIRLGNLAPIPDCHGELKGVCVYAGEIVPVFDISKLLGEATEARSANGWALLLGASEIEMAVLVDRIDSVKSIRTNQLEKLPRAALLSAAGTFINGTLPDGLTFLNAARLLEHETMRIAH
jgi:chemotaxis signal transduction protein